MNGWIKLGICIHAIFFSNKGMKFGHMLQAKTLKPLPEKKRKLVVKNHNRPKMGWLFPSRVTKLLTRWILFYANDISTKLFFKKEPKLIHRLQTLRIPQSQGCRSCGAHMFGGGGGGWAETVSGEAAITSQLWYNNVKRCGDPFSALGSKPFVNQPRQPAKKLASYTHHPVAAATENTEAEAPCLLWEKTGLKPSLLRASKGYGGKLRPVWLRAFTQPKKLPQAHG